MNEFSTSQSTSNSQNIIALFDDLKVELLSDVYRYSIQVPETDSHTPTEKAYFKAYFKHKIRGEFANTFYKVTQHGGLRSEDPTYGLKFEGLGNLIRDFSMRPDLADWLAHNGMAVKLPYEDALKRGFYSQDGDEVNEPWHAITPLGHAFATYLFYSQRQEAEPARPTPPNEIKAPHDQRP
jgi:hypothetical protein